MASIPIQADGIYRGLEASLYDLFWAHADDDAEVTSATAAFIVDQLGGSDLRVLEAGCGSGRILAQLIDQGVDAIGVDLSEPMVAAARRLVGAERCFARDITDTQFDAASFDAVVAPGFTMMLVSDEVFERFLLEAKRLLKPGGKLIFDWFIPWDEIADVSLTNDEDDWSPWVAAKDITLENGELGAEATGARYEVRTRIDRLRQVVTRNQRFSLMKKKKVVQSEENIQAQRWFLPIELKLRLENAGLKLDRIIGDYEDDPAGDWNTLLTAVVSVK
ncbi:class I SAM-dependent methyltransferase [Sulfuriroseicoccus oceanibius]|uniref:Class I SAM-dependent methyltransferase n=1 Tax=Sulfuriroseicoccus oceanibius TaxID=2707525 RepID=A0A6B3LDN4_9BACT|nr:class I SAM-dependent methyltransferase [Sulfuriroseicoccus oceanibius]QQL45453.1 class I SAM-dependent methyltransferase [Sulfuriroseicoccus oceanibius]